jgi:hypothetical protein
VRVSTVAVVVFMCQCSSLSVYEVSECICRGCGRSPSRCAVPAFAVVSHVTQSSEEPGHLDDPAGRERWFVLLRMASHTLRIVGTDQASGKHVYALHARICSMHSSPVGKFSAQNHVFHRLLEANSRVLAG